MVGSVTGTIAHVTDPLHTLRTIIEDWGSKSATAARLNVSRAVLDDRIARLEAALGLSLDDAEIRTSLHLALLHDDLRPTHR